MHCGGGLVFFLVEAMEARVLATGSCDRLKEDRAPAFSFINKADLVRKPRLCR